MLLSRAQLCSKSSQQTPHSSPVRSFASINSDICSDFVTVLMYILSHYIGPRYNLPDSCKKWAYFETKCETMRCFDLSTTLMHDPDLIETSHRSILRSKIKLISCYMYLYGYLELWTPYLKKQITTITVVRDQHECEQRIHGTDFKQHWTVIAIFIPAAIL